jgi:hydroxyacylglutathione hydrolase
MPPEVQVATLTVGAFGSNCHILSRAGDRQALLIDPGDEAPRILAHLREERLAPAAILLTHGHMDHVTALAEVSRAFPRAPVGLHPAETTWAFTPANAMPPYYETPEAPPHLDRAWADGQSWTDAGWTYDIIEIPGHSPGSVGFHFRAEAILFSGDVLFAGSIGRADLPGGHAPTLARSLKRLLELPDETVIYPGHGPRTTIGEERKANPYLRNLSWAR